MKIFNNPNIIKAMKVYNKSGNKPTEKVEATKLNKDKIEISDKAKEIQIATKAFKNLPDVREDRVMEIKEKIQSGSYQVSGKEVTNKIIEGLIVDRKI